ncbi:hypothetical protein SMD27_24020, partial [Dongia soli]
MTIKIGSLRYHPWGDTAVTLQTSGYAFPAQIGRTKIPGEETSLVVFLGDFVERWVKLGPYIVFFG